MKSRSIAQCVIVALLGTSIAAFAQPHDDKHHDDRSSHGPQRHDARPMPHGHGPVQHDAFSGRPGGPVPHSDWHKGDRLPAEYRDRNYVVDDWHGHGLDAPPRGYQWVGVNGDYVLVAAATGVIASVLFSAH